MATFGPLRPGLVRGIGDRAPIRARRLLRGRKQKGISMKLLLIGTAIIAVAGSVLFGQAQAAPAKDPMCGTAFQASNAGWMDHYGCWKGPVVKIAAPKPSKKDPNCSTAFQATNAGWMDHYHCWDK